jgi:hypothetical protein
MTHSVISAERMQYLGRQSDDQLLEELGYALFEKDVGGTLPRPPKLAELTARARAWLKDQHGTITTLVCKNTSLRELVESQPTAREKIVVFIANVLGAHYAGFPVGTLAEILFRGGVSRYCASQWPK